MYELDLDRTLTKRLATDASTREFIHTYGVDAGEAIDWPAVRAVGYTGLEVSVYSMTFRCVDWYYVWDTESGVVWDPATLVACRCVAVRQPDGRYALAPGVLEEERPPAMPPPPPPSAGAAADPLSDRTQCWYRPCVDLVGAPG